MPVIEKPDFKAKKGIPVAMKLTLLLAVFMGIWSRSCWRANELEKIVFENVVIENPTSISVEVIFDINNKTFQKGKKPILIEIFTSTGDVIASRITPVEIEATTTKRYVRQIEGFQRPIRENEYISHARVSLFQKKAF